MSSKKTGVVALLVVFGLVIAYFSLIMIDATCNESLSFCKLYEPLTPF